MEGPWRDTESAARRIGLSASSFEKYRLTGGGPIYSKKGRTIRYHDAEVDAWLREGARRSTSEQAEAA